MKMKNLRDRSKRHANNEDVEQIYSSDVSAIKKLKLVEQNAIKFSKEKGVAPVQSKDENFAGQKNTRKAQAKPTESEQRSIKKLFRRKNDSSSQHKQDGSMYVCASLSRSPDDSKNSSILQKDQNDLIIEIARVSELQTQIQKRYKDYYNKSPR